MTTHVTTTPRGRENAWRIAMWGGAAALLLAPLVAMRLTREVNWGPLDFLVFGAMLFAACGAMELAFRGSRRRTYHAAAAVAVGTAFLLAWATLAVGFVGREDDPANLMYVGVLAVVVLGGYAVRFRAAPMARVLFATAAAQGLAGAIAVLAGWDTWRIAMPTLVFAGAWLASSALFRRAARPRAPA